MKKEILKFFEALVKNTRDYSDVVIVASVVLNLFASGSFSHAVFMLCVIIYAYTMGTLDNK